eukprot:TRINITY_DN1362_c1_g4_i2.p1 TRINITY_DN1362_c1_g4~~TRINITY_DN1362_c1_g4_i2.p1  ORF type:complete len:166 (+),score=54.12 TRINITY_DN1362_c1_g4_i2:60-557(+)
MADADIVWPGCLSFVGYVPPTGLFSMFSSAKPRVISVSGGQLQHSLHPALSGASREALAAKGDAAWREWSLKDVAQLDGYAYDPRDARCSDHAAVNGGLLDAQLELHSNTELTLTTKLSQKPLRIEFIDAATCEKFKALVEDNKACCAQKFNAQVGDEAKKAQAK